MDALSRARSALPVVLGLVLVVGGAAGFVGVLDAVQDADDVAVLDEPVLRLLVALRSEPVTWFMVAVSTVTGPVVLPVLVVVAALVWGFVRRTWWEVVLLVTAMVASTGVQLAIKDLVARPRPPVDALATATEEVGYAFPSGHTIATATFLLVGGYLVWVRRPRAHTLVLWWAVVAAGTALVAGSRLYLGYHFVSDVLASSMLAVAVLGGVVVLDRRRAARTPDPASATRTAGPGA
ncbi:phosphatase PAP2 family protein [Cellulomonas bogoriensis]|nr:phosphatase PAP2 family protein [Cellulomonas bogoriensis]